MRGIAHGQDPRRRNAVEQPQRRAVDLRVGLADLQHHAAQFAVHIGQRPGAQDALARHHHGAVRVDAQHGQAGGGAGLQVSPVGLDRARAAIGVGPGVEQEAGIGHARHDHRGTVIHHRKIALRPDMEGWAGEARIGAGFQQQPARLAAAHDAVMHRQRDAHPLQHLVDVPGAARGIGQKGDTLAGSLHRDQRIDRARVGFAAVMHHAPQVEHIAVIRGESLGDAFDDLQVSAPTASLMCRSPSRASSAARPSRMVGTSTGPP